MLLCFVLCDMMVFFFSVVFFFKQKTAYEMRISDWSSDVCSSDLPIETMLRIHFMQQWFNLSDPAMEEALYDSFSMRQFAKLPGGRAPDETTILNFRHLLEKHNIAENMFAGVTLLLQD